MGYCTRGKLPQHQLHAYRVLSSADSFCLAANSVTFIQSSARSNFIGSPTSGAFAFCNQSVMPSQFPGPTTRPPCFASSMPTSLAKRTFSPRPGPLCTQFPLL